jgi:hypothetical protein
MWKGVPGKEENYKVLGATFRFDTETLIAHCPYTLRRGAACPSRGSHDMQHASRFSILIEEGMRQA